jgi:hypothetical protein
MVRTGHFILLACAAAALVSTPALAQQPTRIRGTIERADGSKLVVRAGEAGPLTLSVTDGVQVYGVVNAKAADIKSGAYVGVGAMPQPDGSQKAIQIMIFAEPMRGIGEGHRPWDRPGSTMTNGTVDARVGSVEDGAFTVKYKDGDKKVVIAPDSVIRAYVVGSKEELKPGANVSAFATKKADGTFETGRINVGRDGAVPQ